MSAVTAGLVKAHAIVAGNAMKSAASIARIADDAALPLLRGSLDDVGRSLSTLMSTGGGGAQAVIGARVNFAGDAMRAVSSAGRQLGNVPTVGAATGAITAGTIQAHMTVAQNGMRSLAGIASIADDAVMPLAARSLDDVLTSLNVLKSSGASGAQRIIGARVNFANDAAQAATRLQSSVASGTLPSASAIAKLQTKVNQLAGSVAASPAGAVPTGGSAISSAVDAASSKVAHLTRSIDAIA